jgi:hypothetical protein
MYGLLSKAYQAYQIKNDTSRENYHGTKNFMKQYMSWPARGAVSIVEIFLTIIALLCLWDCYLAMGWAAWVLVLFLALFFVPVVGDILALTIIAYWVLQVRDHSQILPKLLAMG